MVAVLHQQDAGCGTTEDHKNVPTTFSHLTTHSVCHKDAIISKRYPYNNSIQAVIA